MKFLAGFEMGKISLMLHLVGRLMGSHAANWDGDKHQRSDPRSLACLNWR
jgi:hypothetical protein